MLGTKFSVLEYPFTESGFELVVVFCTFYVVWVIVPSIGWLSLQFPFTDRSLLIFGSLKYKSLLHPRRWRTKFKLNEIPSILLLFDIVPAYQRPDS